MEAYRMPYYMHELSADYNPALGMIQHMTTDELKQMLNDDDRLESMIKGLEQVKRNEAEKEMLLDSNKSLAEFNLSQEPVIGTLRAKLIESYNELMHLKENVEKKKQKLDDIKRQMSLDTTLALLQTAAAESEEESEAVSESFLSAEIPVDSFLEQYLKKRKLAHLRRVKAEKMVELLNHPPVCQPYLPPPQAGAAAPQTSQQSNFGYSSYPTPYPLSVQPNMPMPFFS